MIEINNPSDKSFENITQLAVAVKRFRERRQTHIGLLYRIEGQPLQLLHLLWHFELHSDPPDTSFFWIPCKADAQLLRLFAEWLGVVWARNGVGKIPYSIEYSGRYFDSSGSYVRPSLGEGLTCATFIVAVFADYGLELIDAATWPKRPSLGDRRWQRQIVNELKKRASAAHIAAQERLIDRVSRFRPEQVAGAFGLFSGSAPIEHRYASAAAEIVKATLQN